MRNYPGRISGQYRGAKEWIAYAQTRSRIGDDAAIRTALICVFLKASEKATGACKGLGCLRARIGTR